jgi:hypothetical protein
LTCCVKALQQNVIVLQDYDLTLGNKMTNLPLHQTLRDNVRQCYNKKSIYIY